MRLISIYRVTSGMQLAKSILGQDGTVLLKEHVFLTDGYIRQLMKLGVHYVYIHDNETADVTIQESVSVETQQLVVGRIKEIYDRMANQTRTTNFINSGYLSSEFQELFQILFDEIKDNQTFIVNLSAIYTSDAFLYAHCMNVGIYASVLAIAKGYNESQIKNFGIGAMLHDIGKLYINDKILNKPGRLTDEERTEIERHTWFGYEILMNQTDLPTVSAHCALQHHEKYDGTGYPRRLKNDEIHEYGRMLAVPDVYDALTSNRVYRKAYLPHEGLEYLYANVGTHFDPQFVDLFQRHVNIYPTGLPVDLSNGSSGVISGTNSHHLQRPIVLVLMENGVKVKPYEIDLARQLNIIITGCNLESVNYVTA